MKSDRAHTPAGATPNQAHTPVHAYTPSSVGHTPGAHTPGAPRTPGAATPGTAHTPGMAHTPGTAHTPGMACTPLSLPPPTSDMSAKRLSKHLMYVIHFPIPQDEFSQHECNQRMITLYGVGKARDEARHGVRKLIKEITKMFGKKNSLDISSGDGGNSKNKKKKDKDDSQAMYDSCFQKMRKLSYYDQHAVLSTCCQSIIEMLNSFSSGSSTYLPQVEHLSFVFDLLEYACNINGLIEFVIQVWHYVRMYVINVSSITLNLNIL